MIGEAHTLQSGRAPRQRPRPDTGGNPMQTHPNTPSTDSRSTLAQATAQAKAKPGRDVRVERGIYVRATRAGEVRYVVLSAENGVNVWSRPVASLAEARKLRAKLTTTQAEGGSIVRPKPATLAEYATRWLDAQAGTVRASTLASYRSHYATHLAPKLGTRKLATITKADVRQLVAELREAGKATATIRRVLQVLRLIYAEAVEDRFATVNPVTALPDRDRKALAARKGDAEFPDLDAGQVAALVNAAPERHRLLVALAVYSGLRQGELLGLRWRDVARDANGEPVLRVRHSLTRDGQLAEPKTAKAVRDVAIAPALAKALTEHRLASRHSGDDDYVFASATGSPLHYRNVARRALDPAVKAAKLPRLRWHDLRHVAASQLIADGHPVTYVSRQLGHASPSITLDTYSHLFAAREQADAHRAAQEARLAGVAL